MKSQKKKTTSDSISEESYLKVNFPLEVGEYKADFRHLWARNYRINYWQKKGNTNIISRSIFVQLYKDKDGKWEHRIFPD